MKTLLHKIRKNMILSVLAISLLTACRAAGNAAPQESAAPEAVFPGTAGRIPSPEDSGSAPALSELQVHFIDVGQGDSTLIICGEESMLIDAGDNSRGTAIQLYLLRQGVESLTYLIGTHPDSDHIGGLDVIMTKFQCGMVIMPDAASDTAAYRDVIDTMEYRNYTVTPPRVGDVYSLGDAEFTIIAPNGEYPDDNDSSVGIRLVHGNNVFLFTGDAEADAEADILQNGIDIRADVLHVGHHGSGTSNSPDFISRVSPVYAVISCGSDNPYGHPHGRTMRTLKELGVQVFRTDEQGSIVAVSDGDSIWWDQEPSQTWNTGNNAVSDIPSVPGAGTGPAGAVTYVLNHNTNKFHAPDCPSVKSIKDSNREDTTLSREEILAAGFLPCRVCGP